MGFSYKHIYLELDGRFYVYKSSKVEELIDLSDVAREGVLVTDFPGSITRVMEVGSAPKFAEVMARRQIEEEGEFDQAISIIPYWRRKRAKNSTQIFLTALPHQIYEQYMNHVQEAREPIVLYSLYGVLCEVVKRYGKKGPVAVAFQHGKVVDLIVGTPKRIYSANRSMAFDETADQIDALWDMVLSDIRSTESENKIKVGKVLLVSWVDTTPPKWEGDLGFHLEPIEEEVLEIQGERRKASFFSLIKGLSPGASISRGIEKWALRSRVAIIPMNLFILVATILVFLGHMYLSNKVKALETDYQRIVQGLSWGEKLQVKAEIPPQYIDTLGFIKRLHRAAKFPSYKTLINDLAESFGSQMTVEMLDANYGKSELKAEIRGHIEAPFDTAYKAYQRSMIILNRKGYEIQDSSFSTSIRESRFLLKLSKTVK